MKQALEIILYKGKITLLLSLLVFLVLSYTSAYINISKSKKELNISKKDLIGQLSRVFIHLLDIGLQLHRIILYAWINVIWVSLCAVPMALFVFVQQSSVQQFIAVQYTLCLTLRCIFLFNANEFGSHYLARYSVGLEMTTIGVGFVLLVAFAYRYYCVVRD